MASEKARKILMDSVGQYPHLWAAGLADPDELIAAIVEAERGEPSQGEGQPLSSGNERT